MYQIEKSKPNNYTSKRKRIDFIESHQSFKIGSLREHTKTSTFIHEIWGKHNSK
jgi:hypothetical protein